MILEDLDPDAIISRKKLELMEKVLVTAARDLSTSEVRENIPESAQLKVSFSDGRQLSGFCGEAYGMPGRPLSYKDLLFKFDSCLVACGRCAEAFDFASVDLQNLASKILYYDVETHLPIVMEDTKDRNMIAFRH